jgi:hypothetical protein
MKKVYLITIWVMALLIAAPSFGQIGRRAIKRNNKNMRQYRGQKNTFTKQKQYDYIAISLNAMNYFGDIVPSSSIGSTKISFTRPGISVTYGHRFGPRYTFQASFSYGRLQSDDANVADPGGENSKFRYIRNAQFRNDIIELSTVAIFDLYKNDGSYLNRVEWTPYALIGVAGFHHNPQAKVPDTYIHTGATLPEAGQWVPLEPLGTEGQYTDLLLDTDANFGIKPYSLWQLAIPFGLGVRLAVGEALDFSFDITMRYLFTDYLDDVSRNYVDLGVLDGDLAKAMSDRSREPVAVVTGETRDISSWSTQSYVGRDGQTYEVINGFGREHPSNVRGGSSANDMYFVTSIRMAYIIGASFRRAKFR